MIKECQRVAVSTERCLLLLPYLVSRVTNLFLKFTITCIFIFIELNLHHGCIKAQQTRYFWNSSLRKPARLCLNCSHCSVTLEMLYQSRPHKQGFERSRVLWALFQHCSSITSQKAGVSIAGPSLNISHCLPLLGSLREKGNHNKFSSATSPYFHLPSLSLSLYLYCSVSASLFSPTQSLFHFFQPLSTSGSLFSLPFLPISATTTAPPSSSPVRVVMALKDVCDVIQTDCSSVSGMPLPPLPPATSRPPPPTSILQSPLRHEEAFLSSVSSASVSS